MNHYIIPGIEHRTYNSQVKIAASQHTINRIMKAVSIYFDLPVETIKSKSRLRKIVYPRQFCMYLIRQRTNFSLQEIGKIFDRDHSTIIHSVELMNDLLCVDDTVRNDAKNINELLDASS